MGTLSKLYTEFQIRRGMFPKRARSGGRALSVYPTYGDIEVNSVSDSALSTFRDVIIRGRNARISLGTEPRCNKPFYSLVTTNFSCFRELDIEGVMSRMEPSPPLPPGDAKGLKELRIFVCRGVSYYETDLSSSFIEGISHLWKLVVDDKPLSMSFLSRLTLEKITTLDLWDSRLDSDDAFTPLSRCVSIVGCGVGLASPI